MHIYCACILELAKYILRWQICAGRLLLNLRQHKGGHDLTLALGQYAYWLWGNNLRTVHKHLLLRQRHSGCHDLTLDLGQYAYWLLGNNLRTELLDLDLGR